MQISVSRFLCGKMGEEIKNQTELFRRKVFPGRRRPEITRKKREGKLLPGEFRLRPPEGASEF